jgi:hypothetical protein
MQVLRSVGRTNRWIPAFVANNAQLRCVILHATIGYVFRGGKVPATVQTDLVFACSSFFLVRLQFAVDLFCLLRESFRRNQRLTCDFAILPDRRVNN